MPQPARPTLSTPCATPECDHPYNWHIPGGVCSVEGCFCKAFAVSTRAVITPPAADHIAAILREERAAPHVERMVTGAIRAGCTADQTQEAARHTFKETAPVPDTDPTPKRAVVYLAHPEPNLDGDDLYRRTRLRIYAMECGYQVDAVITAHDPANADEPPIAYQLIRRALRDEDVDVIVLWNTDLDVPDTLTRADLPDAGPHTHVYVTALDGDDKPALDAEGKTWTHCGICGDLPPAVGGKQPLYSVGARVRYDDDEGHVLEHRFNGERNAWDALVRFTEGLRPGWCWESDLTPANDEGE